MTRTDVQLAYTCFYATNPNTNAPYMGYAANTGEQSLTMKPADPQIQPESGVEPRIRLLPEP